APLTRTVLPEPSVWSMATAWTLPFTSPYALFSRPIGTGPRWVQVLVEGGVEVGGPPATGAFGTGGRPGARAFGTGALRALVSSSAHLWRFSDLKASFCWKARSRSSAGERPGARRPFMNHLRRSVMWSCSEVVRRGSRLGASGPPLLSGSCWANAGREA